MKRGGGVRHRGWLLVVCASVAVSGCSEVLDFGTVCAPDVPRVNLQLYVPDPLRGATCDNAWSGVQIDVLTPEGAPTFVGVSMDLESRSSSGKAGLVTAGSETPLLVSLNRATRPLAIWITSVDLTSAHCGDLVDVDLTAAPAWRTPADIGIPADITPGSPMADALAWAVDAWEGSLDEDDDGCVNVQESCRESLFDTRDTSSCPDP